MLLCISLPILTLSQPKSLRAYLSYTTFNTPDDMPYVETYLAIEGNSVVFAKTPDGNFQSTIEITMLFRQDETIVDFAKYELKSPRIDDTSSINFGFIDQQRFALAAGEYVLEILIADLNNDKTDAFQTFEILSLDFPSDQINISGIQLLERFEKTDQASMVNKSGYDLIPMVYAFYPESQTNLAFYSEIYNSVKIFGEAKRYMVNYFIESFEQGKTLNDYFFRRRMETAPVNILLNNINISRLPSGNYNLVVEVRNRENELVASNKVFFQRSNPGIQFNLEDIAALNVASSFAGRYNNYDTLADFILSLAPISSQMERAFAENLVREKNIKTMQQFFYNFWLSRNYSSPEMEWREYYAEVQKVNAAFGTPFRRGYDSDRGRVYLQYGPPNQMIENYNEPNAYPYEIWQYYTLGNQRNKRFVFYSKDMATNDFALLHSDAVGEISNHQWQYVIEGRMNVLPGVDDTRPTGAFGSRARTFYNDLR